MARMRSVEADKMLDKQVPVLDKGFVRLIDYMGTDSRIVQSARVSYGGGTKSKKEDRGLIFYLMEHEHTSPFEQVVFLFHVKLPIFVARQWVRHRTARLNELSGRYSVLSSEAYLPDLNRLGVQKLSNKQGTSKVDKISVSDKQKIIRQMEHDQFSGFGSYNFYLSEFNLARELARINLPLSTYTEWYWQIDLHNLFHFLKLRLDKHAQFEIQQYGKAMIPMVKAVSPIAYEAFEEFVLHSVTFSATKYNDLLVKIGDAAELL